MYHFSPESDSDSTYYSENKIAVSTRMTGTQRTCQSAELSPIVRYIQETRSDSRSWRQLSISNTCLGRPGSRNVSASATRNRTAIWCACDTEIQKWNWIFIIIIIIIIIIHSWWRAICQWKHIKIWINWIAGANWIAFIIIYLWIIFQIKQLESKIEIII